MSESLCSNCQHSFSLCYQGCQVSCYHFKNGCLAWLECFRPCFAGIKSCCSTSYQCIKSLIANTCCFCCTYCDAQPWVENLCNCDFRFSNPFLIADQHTAQFTLLLNEFESRGIFTSKQLQQCELLQHKITQELIIMKQRDITQASELQKELYEFQLSLQFIHLFQLRCKLFGFNQADFQQKKIDTFCSQNYRQYLFYDYILNDLQTEWTTRKQKNLQFLQLELFGFLLAGLSTLVYLQQNGLPLNIVSLNLKQIYISQKGYFKFNCQKISTTETIKQEMNILIILRQNRQKYVNKLTLICNKELQGIREVQPESQNSCLFQLGMLVVQLGLMDGMHDCYNYQLLANRPNDSNIPELQDIQRIQAKTAQLKQHYDKGVKSKYQYLKELTDFIDKLMTISHIDRFSVLNAYQELFSLQTTQNLIFEMGPEFQLIYTQLLNPSQQFNKLRSQQFQMANSPPLKSQQQSVKKEPVVASINYSTRNTKYDLQEILKRKNYQMTQHSKLEVDNAFQQILRSKNYQLGFKRKSIKARLLGVPPAVHSKSSSFMNQYNRMLGEQVFQNQQEQLLEKELLQKQLLEQQLQLIQQASEIPVQSLKKSKQQEFEFVKEIYPNGCIYEGYKLNGMREGHGKYCHPNGSFYEGEWVQNKMQGQGKFYNENGFLIYDGKWKEDEFDGDGIQYNDLLEDQQAQDTFDYSDMNKLQYLWTKYTGEFKNDMKQGHGILLFVNGDQFEGEFKEDQINGLGQVTINKTGQVLRGKWNNGILE